MFGNTLLGQRVPAAISNARSAMEQHFTSDLRKKMREAGWPESIVSEVVVVNSTEGFRVDIPEEIRGSALDVEFGTHTTPPTGTLRTFMLRLGRGTSPEALLDNLGGAL